VSQLIRKWRLEIFLAAMVLLTIGALLGQDRLLQERLVITPDDQHVVEVLDDSQSGGSSTARVIGSNGFEWECVLGSRLTYPFCEMDLFLGGGPVQGLDLRQYKTLRVWLDYAGPGKSIRLYLRNFDPRYSKASDASTTKFNQVEIPSEEFKDGVADVALSDFFVADWWVASKGVAPGLRRPQFENVVILEIQTGSAEVAGKHHFALQRLELFGQRIPTEQLYLLIVIGWVIVVILFLGFRVAALRQEVRLQRERARDLAEVNALLDRHSRELEEKTKRDHLTGAFNRHGVEEMLQVALGEWRRQRKPMSLVLMDIDKFKQINDRHGHGYGDYVLAEVSQIVKECIRPKDLFARWGGEEFLLVCRNTSLEDAQTVAEKIRLLIARHVFDRGVLVTASFGVATLSSSDSLEELFHCADQALYRAKSEGRNQVVVALSDTARLRIA
jgi:diguanylate cyclase (GGDEF)-like protein